MLQTAALLPIPPLTNHFSCRGFGENLSHKFPASVSSTHPIQRKNSPTTKSSVILNAHGHDSDFIPVHPQGAEEPAGPKGRGTQRARVLLIICKLTRQDFSLPLRSTAYFENNCGKCNVSSGSEPEVTLL